MDTSKTDPLNSSKVGDPIAHLPLNNSPILEGVDILPPTKDDVEELAMAYFESKGHNLYNHYNTMPSFKEGYNKAKEKYKYTEEDVRKAITMARELEDWWNIVFEYGNDEIIKSLHQYPTEFISDDEISHEGSGTYSTDLMDIGVSNLKPIKVPKTITTAQGIQWVGKYK